MTKQASRTPSRHVLGATAVGLAILAMTACDSGSNSAEELIESASDGQADVDIDPDGDGGLSIETEDGSLTIDGDGNFTATDQNGDVATGNISGDGADINAETEDGSFQMSDSSGVPDAWPDEVPAPEGMDDATSAVTSGEQGMSISLINGSNVDLVEEYGPELEDAGFELTASFDTPGNVSETYVKGPWTVIVNVFGEGADAAASVTLYSESAG